MALGKSPTAIVASGNYPLLIIAPHWERIPLGDIAIVQNGSAFSSDFFTQGEGMPLIRIRDVKRELTENFYSGPFEEEFVVRKGDLLIGMDGDFHTAFWKGANGLLNQRVCRLLPKTELYERTFLFLVLKPYLDAINAETSSVTVKHLSSRTIAEIPLPLPPLPEQKRIVAKIEELFSELEAGEASLRKARRQLSVYRQSLLIQAFEGKLTQKWRTQNPHKLESTVGVQSVVNSPELPESWNWIKLGSAIEEPAYGTSKKCSYESGGLGVLRIPNVVKGAIEADDLKFAEFTEAERKSYELKEGDLLLIRSNGSVSIVGRCAIIEPKHNGFLYAGYLIRLRPRAALLNSRFLRDQMSSHSLRSQIEFAAKSTSGVNNINSKEIQRLVIALPPLPEQQEIVRILDEQFEAIERNERELDAALKRSEALRQAILKKAFSGHLIPQDPADEPAPELLKRIRLEQKTSNQTKQIKMPKKSIDSPTEKQTLIEVLRKSPSWIKAQQAFAQIGISRGSSTVEIEAAYDQLRSSLDQIEVERRGSEDWLRLRKRRVKL